MSKIFNRNNLKIHRDRAAKTINVHDIIMQEYASILKERIDDFPQNFVSTLEIGSRHGILYNKLLNDKRFKTYLQCDLSIKMLDKNHNLQFDNLKFVCDEEFLPVQNNKFDLVLSMANLHWVNDLPGCLIQINKTLKNNGIFIANFPGTRTLYELEFSLNQAQMILNKGICAHTPPKIDCKTFGSLMQRANFKESVIDSSIIKICYSNLVQLILDIRYSGEANILVNHPIILNPKILNLCEEIYRENFSDKAGNLIASFEVITANGYA